MIRPSILVPVFCLLPWATGCAGAAEDERGHGEDSSGSGWCMPGLDSDADGVADYHDSAYVVPATPSECRDELHGAVLGRAPGLPEDSAPSIQQQDLGTDGSGTLTEGQGFPYDVLRDVDASGIDQGKWVKDVHDCDDFAGDLEEYLQSKGWCATFTLIWRDQDRDGKYDSGHAVTDVHIGEDTFWIEPQTGLPVKLDMDGDGQVRVSAKDAGGRYATEQTGVSITVFESRKEAESLGYQMD